MAVLDAKAIACTFALVASLSSIEANADSETSTADEPTPSPRTCMFARNVDDFHVIDRNHVVLIDRRPGTYLLGEMRPGCWDIRHAPGIALQHRYGSVCEGDSTTILVMTSLQNFSERCYVSGLLAVGSVEAAEALLQEQEDAENND